MAYSSIVATLNRYGSYWLGVRSVLIEGDTVGVIDQGCVSVGIWIAGMMFHECVNSSVQHLHLIGIGNTLVSKIIPFVQIPQAPHHLPPHRAAVSAYYCYCF